MGWSSSNLYTFEPGNKLFTREEMPFEYPQQENYIGEVGYYLYPYELTPGEEATLYRCNLDTRVVETVPVEWSEEAASYQRATVGPYQWTLSASARNIQCIIKTLDGRYIAFFVDIDTAQGRCLVSGAPAGEERLLMSFVRLN